MEESAPGEELEAAIPSMEKMEEDESVGSEVDFGDTFAEFGDHIISDHDGSVDSHSMQPAAGPIIVEAVEGDVDDPYKSEATLCLDIQKFSEFSCCYPTAHRVLGNYVYARGLPWRILATVKERASSDPFHDFQKERGVHISEYSYESCVWDGERSKAGTSNTSMSKDAFNGSEPENSDEVPSDVSEINAFRSVQESSAAALTFMKADLK
uniref:MATH domain-containing protein n=1 Tax=Ascaris lumbricoides TaxID=6252 RepID=A0A9J2PV95_ASCLU